MNTESCVVKCLVIGQPSTRCVVQRSCEQAMGFCERKVTEMRKQIDEVGEDIKGREGALQQVEQLLQQRVAEMKQQEQAAASADALA